MRILVVTIPLLLAMGCDLDDVLTTDTEDIELVTQGKGIYDEHCIGCHQADGTGGAGELAADFIADRERLAKSDFELLASIRDGREGAMGMMPPWKEILTPYEMRAGLAYLRAEFGD